MRSRRAAARPWRCNGQWSMVNGHYGGGGARAELGVARRGLRDSTRLVPPHDGMGAWCGVWCGGRVAAPQLAEVEDKRVLYKSYCTS